MKTINYHGLKIRIERPKGFVQEGKDAAGNSWRRIYQYDYGFLPRTDGGDGEGVDVFVGPASNARTTYWALQRKKDGAFDEYKVFMGFVSKAAAKQAYQAHIPLRYFAGMVAVPLAMVKAMLGVKPDEKVAMFLGLVDELQNLGAGDWSRA